MGLYSKQGQASEGTRGDAPIGWPAEAVGHPAEGTWALAGGCWSALGRMSRSQPRPEEIHCLFWHGGWHPPPGRSTTVASPVAAPGAAGIAAARSMPSRPGNRQPELDVMRALVVAGLVVFHSALVLAPLALIGLQVDGALGGAGWNCGLCDLSRGVQMSRAAQDWSRGLLGADLRFAQGDSRVCVRLTSVLHGKRMGVLQTA